MLNLFRRAGRKSVFSVHPKPDTPSVVFGDVHGCADLCQRLLEQNEGTQIVGVGDYIDRGPHSSEVLRLLSSREDVVCVAGNHEAMLLEFLEAPDGFGRRWLRYGGIDTLGSFNVKLVRYDAPAEDLVSARDALLAAMGDRVVSWLRSLPAFWQSGNVCVVHAGADPARPVGDQSAENLYWGHPMFRRNMRNDGLWVIYGHTIQTEVSVDKGKICVDTGAYRSGVLSAVYLDGSAPQIRTVR